MSFYTFSNVVLFLKLAVYNPARGDGFLGNRIKLLKKAAKRIASNLAVIEQLNANPTETQERGSNDLPDAQQLIDFLKTADIDKDLAIIRDYHKSLVNIAF